MKFRWDEKKNKALKISRGISFDDIIEVMDSNTILDVRRHPNKLKYPKQFLMYVQFNDYVYVIPFIYENSSTIFLKTIFKSRKAKKEFDV